MSLPLYQNEDHLMSQSGHLNQWLIPPQVHQNVAHFITLHLVNYMLIDTTKSLLGSHNYNYHLLCLKECMLGKDKCLLLFVDHRWPMNPAKIYF